ncbi:hypothetical protein M413DRAFT_76483, partial [Hebeloma cylindrosporum]
LNRCLCGLVVNPDVDFGNSVQCKQAGCETQWYHLQCIGLELAPGRWVCEACEASGRARAKRIRK